MGNPFIIYSDEQKSPASARCQHREPQSGSELPLRQTATRQQHTSDRRRMLDTFVEVVRRGMQEGVDEVTVTYNAPVAPRPGAEPQDDRGDSEDLPDLLPINDVWGPPDSDEDADEEDLIQEFGQPMDTSSDSPAQRSMSEQAALERQAITDNPEWAFQRRRSRATAERSRASLADQGARAAHLEMLGLLRREWDRAREGSPQGRAARQPENLTSVRRVAREVLAQLDSRIESMTARQRERQPAVERPAALGRQRDRPQEPGSSRGAMTWNTADVPSLFSPPRAAQGAVARERERDPFLTYEEMRQRMRPLLGDNGVHLSPFLSRRSLLRGPDMGQSPADHVTPEAPSQPEMWSRTSGAAQLL